MRNGTHAELGEDADGVTACVLRQCARDNLHRVRDRAERPSLDAGDRTRLGVQSDGAELAWLDTILGNRQWA